MYLTYVITAQSLRGNLVYKYDDKGVLRVYENNAELNDEQLAWFTSRLPIRIEYLNTLVAASGGKLKLTEVPADLSFESFWSKYGNKKGSKTQAENLWEGCKVTENKRPITEADRMAILQKIGKIKASYDKRGIEMPYPTTFLMQRRWENEY